MQPKMHGFQTSGMQIIQHKLQLTTDMSIFDLEITLMRSSIKWQCMTLQKLGMF